MNALMKASRVGDLKALRAALKDPKIDPNLQDNKTGMTALHTATIWQNSACVRELLLDGRINPHTRDLTERRAIDLTLGMQLNSLIEATYAANIIVAHNQKIPSQILTNYSSKNLDIR